ncbi:MAG: hypothetical protein ACLKAO_11800 [Alkaliphilus sp.]
MAKKSKKKNSLNSTVIGVAQNELIQKHGEAASQSIQAYKGIRVDSSGVDLGHKGRSLKEISKYKINPGHKDSNIKQQSGFTAELIKESRDNKKAILSGDTTRTRTTDGIGRTNDQTHDHVQVDENNEPIIGSGSQMKMKGKHSTEKEIIASSEKTVKNMVSKKWEKYADSPMDIPSEQVEPAKKFAREEAKKLRLASKNARAKGDLGKAKMLEEKAEKFETTEKNIRDAGVSSKDAINARLSPRKFVVKEVMLDSHNAGIEAGKGAAVLSGGISLVQNVIEVGCRKKPLDEAVKDVAVTTIKSSTVAYGTGAAGTAVKATMHASKKGAIRALGKTNAPTMMVTGLLEIGKSIHRFANGEIDEVELLQESGEKGTGMVAASYGAAMGTLILPGVGTIIGGMIGHTINSALYKETLLAFKNAKISAERRRELEKVNARAILEMKRYQKLIEAESKGDYARRTKLFAEVFEGLNNSIMNNNIDRFFENINMLGNEFGIKFQFESFDEFDDFMENEDSILLI